MAVVLLGTVAIEPNRWATVDPSGQPTTELSAWLDAIADARFDGIELWERHFSAVDDSEAGRIVEHPLETRVFNTYASFDEPADDVRRAAATNAGRTGASGVKFNVGNESDQRDLYADRLAAFVDDLPAGTAALCECHSGISIAEEPAVAAAIFDRAGSADRVQAIVHTHESLDHLRTRFDAYGDRITHVHVNFLGVGDPGAPPLANVRTELEARINLLDQLGFAGTWTLEFVHGLLTDADRPGPLLEQAAVDLTLLRDLLP